MKAVRINNFGGPEQVRIEEIPTPEVKPRMSRVRVKAVSVNPVDWMIREKIYNPEGADRVPMTLGQDFAGVIDAVGRGDKSPFREGDEVFGEAWGAFAEYVLLPTRDLVRKPPSIDPSVAAAIPMIGLTAWQAIVDTAEAGPGMRFLIHGAGGGVGSMAVQFAKLKEARVVATGSGASIEYLRSIGVEQVIDYETQTFEELVSDVDVVLDPLGGETQARSWGVLKKGGMLINLVGEIDETAAKRGACAGSSSP